MNKVGIITFHFHNNYGTMLQAYALQRKISDLGYSAELIDYRMTEYAKSKQELLQIRRQRFFVYIKEFPVYYAKLKGKKRAAARAEYFRDFYKNHMVTSLRQYHSLKELEQEPQKYDVYIAGSDQIWNPNVSNNPDAYYLTFAPEDAIRGSYAPSVGVKKLEEFQSLRLKKLFMNFDYLSCREESGAKLIHLLTNRHVETVLDPTLLLTSQIWSELEIEADVKEPYILQYFLGDVKECRAFVEELKIKTGLKVVTLPHSHIDILDKKEEKYYIGPSQFLWLIHHAEYICTDSFHGTAFSINYNKEFYAFCKKKDTDRISDNARLQDILHNFELEERLIADYKLSETIRRIDYDKTNKILNRLRDSSQKYLIHLLEKSDEYDTFA